MKRKGFRYYVSEEQIRTYTKLSPLDKLSWLAEANEFTRKYLKGKRKKIWEMFRERKI